MIFLEKKLFTQHCAIRTDTQEISGKTIMYMYMFPCMALCNSILFRYTRAPYFVGSRVCRHQYLMVFTISVLFSPLLYRDAVPWCTAAFNIEIVQRNSHTDRNVEYLWYSDTLNKLQKLECCIVNCKCLALLTFSGYYLRNCVSTCVYLYCGHYLAKVFAFLKKFRLVGRVRQFWF